MSTVAPLDELRKILTIEQLPAMPQSALTILQLDNDIAKINIDDLVRPIEADPGLAVQVLKFLNSSYFGFQSMISNVKQGIALVGIRIVKNFVLWKAVFSLIPKSRHANFDVGFLWQDSLRRAMFARFLLLELKQGDPEIAFAGALLQDMSIPLLLKQRPDEYGKVLKQLTTTPDIRLSTLERETFGWTHADADGILGRCWKLPIPLIAILENHLWMDELIGNVDNNIEQTVVALSAFLPMAVKPIWNEKNMFVAYFKQIVSENDSLLRSLFTKVDIGFDQYASILQISKPRYVLNEMMEM